MFEANKSNRALVMLENALLLDKKGWEVFNTQFPHFAALQAVQKLFHYYSK
jgi:hypothetical protein